MSCAEDRPETRRIAQLLAESLAAHRAATLLRQAKQSTAACQKLREAADLRRQADAADPAHESPAWADEDRVTPKGKVTHDELMAFYARQGV
jgi:hypothetical protein